MDGEPTIIIDLTDALDMLIEGQLPVHIGQRVLRMARDELVELRKIEQAARHLADQVADNPDPNTYPTAQMDVIRTIRRQY